MREEKKNITRVRLFMKVFFCVLPLPILVIVFFLYYKPPLYLLNSKQENVKEKFALWKYIDEAYKDENPELNIVAHTNSVLSFKYKLKARMYKPLMVGYQFYKNGRYLDLSEYNFIKVKVKSTQGNNISVGLSSYEPSLTKEEDSLSYRLLSYRLHVSNESKEWTIPFDELTTPWWWQDRYYASKLGPPDYSKIKFAYFTNTFYLEDLTDVITIEEISFGKSLFPLYIKSGLMLFLYYAGFWALFIRKKKDTKARVSFLHHDEISSTTDNGDLKMLLTYLTSNYSTPELSTSDVEYATGISEQNISKIIKENTSLSFKQFLNQLRLTEARRLLLETELQISEIAFKVGYGNISHFNRVFKASEEISPNDFRRKKEERKNTKGDFLQSL
jgi:AraC-like DNA-binding protein